MSGILTYLKWRNDLTMKQDPLNEVDALLLSQLSYLNFDGIVGRDFSKKGITILEAANRFFNSDNYLIYENDDAFNKESTVEMLKIMGNSRRFGNMVLCGFRNEIVDAQEKQFAALTIMPGDRSIFISFRGTDNTLTGWKEDFNMGFLFPVPAQIAAAEYLNQGAAAFPFYQIRVGGHSKGGNLAVYAAANLKKRKKRRIIDVYNHDGPGFNAEVIQKENFMEIKEKMKSYRPQSSIVGMILETGEPYKVVRSTENGIFQHDPFSWMVVGNTFESCADVDETSRFFDRALREWLSNMNEEQREKFVDTMFGILSETNIKNMTEFNAERGKHIYKMLKSAATMDDESKELISRGIGLMFQAMKNNMPDFREMYAGRTRKEREIHEETDVD